MTTSDYLMDSALVLLVLLQIKERPLSTKTLIRPLIILGVAVANYFHSIPTAGNDLVLIGGLVAVGASIGAASGVTVKMRPGAHGDALVRTGWLSGFFWVLGMGSRFAFAYWITHTGAASLASFSVAHSITSAQAWTDALLGMAVGEVIARTVVLAARRNQTARQAAPAARLSSELA